LFYGLEILNIQYHNFKEAKTKETEEIESEIFPELEKIKEEIDKAFSQPIASISTESPIYQTQRQATQSVMGFPFGETQGTAIYNTPQKQIMVQQPTIPTISSTQFQIPPQPKIETQVTLEKAEKVEEKPELYIKIDDYKRVLELLDKLKLKVKELENIFTQLREMKERESDKIEELRQQLEDTKENLNNILGILKQP